MNILVIGWAFLVGFLAGKALIAGADLRNARGELTAMEGRRRQLAAQWDVNLKRLQGNVYILGLSTAPVGGKR